MRFPGKMILVSFAVAALVTACKTSTAAGGAGGEADGGMGSAVEGAKSGIESGAQAAADAGAEAYGAAKEKASGAATTAAEAAQSAGAAAADAGAQAYGSAKEKAESAMGGEDGGTAEAATADAGTSEAAAPVSDAQIAAIVHAANQGDLLKSQLAKKRTRNAKVKAFANLMIKDHKAMDAQAKKLGIEPEDNETSRALTQGAQDALSKLEGLKGKEFDSAYADNEVSSHEKVIKTVEEQLIPNAKDAKLKKLLESADKKLKVHLEHAQKLKDDLSK